MQKFIGPIDGAETKQAEICRLADLPPGAVASVSRIGVLTDKDNDAAATDQAPVVRSRRLSIILDGHGVGNPGASTTVPVTGPAAERVRRIVRGLCPDTGSILTIFGLPAEIERTPSPKVAGS